MNKKIIILLTMIISITGVCSVFSLQRIPEEEFTEQEINDEEVGVEEITNLIIPLHFEVLRSMDQRIINSLFNTLLESLDREQSAQNLKMTKVAISKIELFRRIYRR